MGKITLAGKRSIFIFALSSHQFNGTKRSSPKDLKLIEVFETGKYELYNVRKDIGENHDLASKMPKVVRNMANDLKVEKESGARMAGINKSYDPNSDRERKSSNFPSREPDIYGIPFPFSKNAFLPSDPSSDK